jgi:type I restriction enzyme S subunit
MSSFFTFEPAEDDLYNSLRDGLTFSEDEKIIQSMFLKDDKKNIEHMWSLYEPYADKNFLQEVRKDFHPRFWEMYLGFSLINQGVSLEQYDKRQGGPDLLILSDEKLKVWLEAVAPTAGRSANAVPEIEFGDIPDEQIKLRYCSVIDKKYKKYYDYTQKKIISEDDCYVIAVNCRAIPSASKEIDIPRIVRCVLPFGNEVIEIDIDSLEVLDVHHQYQGASYNESGSPVSTNIFLNSDYDVISAILFSNVDALNYPNYPGNDFVLIHNPIAKNPLPRGFIELGREYWVENSTLKHRSWINH